MTGAAPLPGREAGAVPYSLEGVGLIARDSVSFWPEAREDDICGDRPEDLASLESYATFEALWQAPELWQHSPGWFNAQARAEACQEGRTSWLYGQSERLGQVAAVACRCGLRNCDDCAQERGGAVRQVVEAWMEETGDRPVMFTLTCKRVGSMLKAYRYMAPAWRKAWPKIARRLPQCRRCRECRRLYATVCEKCNDERPSKPPGGAACSAGGRCRWRKPTCEVAKGEKCSWGLIPYAWCLEGQMGNEDPERRGWAHLHVGIPSGFLQTEAGARDGQAVVMEEWAKALNDVAGYDLGGYAWLSIYESRDPARYLAKYVGKTTQLPEAVQAMLWGENIRTFNCTHRRKVWTEVECQEAWDRESFVWVVAKRAEAEMAMLRDAGDGFTVAPWSELKADRTIERTQVIHVADWAYTFARRWNAERDDVEWAKVREGPAPN